MTHTDASIPIDPGASPTAVSMADQHNRKVDDQICQAQRELGPWLRQIGFDENDVTNLVLRFSNPDFGVTNRAILFSLDAMHVDEILESSPLGHKVVIKKALKREKNK